MATATCHYCEQPATTQCPTCGRLHCADHGDDVCMRCMAPEAGVPSSVLYRGALAALVLASVVAMFLIFNPPEDESGTQPLDPLPTSTGLPTATPEGGITPTVGAGTPGATGVPTTGATVYVVQTGDTPSGVAEEFGITLDQLIAANPAADFDSFPVGMELTIPAPEAP